MNVRNLAETDVKKKKYIKIVIALFIYFLLNANY